MPAIPSQAQKWEGVETLRARPKDPRIHGREKVQTNKPFRVAWETKCWYVNPRVRGSIPRGFTISTESSIGRAKGSIMSIKTEIDVETEVTEELVSALNKVLDKVLHEAVGLDLCVSVTKESDTTIVVDWFAVN